MKYKPCSIVYGPSSIQCLWSKRDGSMTSTNNFWETVTG